MKKIFNLVTVFCLFFVFGCEKKEKVVNDFSSFSIDEKKLISEFESSDFLNNLKVKILPKDGRLDYKNDVRFDRVDDIALCTITYKRASDKNFPSFLISFFKNPLTNKVEGLVMDQRQSLSLDGIHLTSGKVLFNDEFGNEFGGIEINHAGKGKFLEGKDLNTLLKISKNVRSLGSCTGTCYATAKKACSSDPTCDMLWDLTGGAASTALSCGIWCVTHNNKAPGQP